MGLFDVHAHLTDPRLAAIETQVLERAEAAGLSTIVCNGLNPTDNARVAALAARSPLVQPAFGLYPVDAVLPEMTAMGIEYPREEAELQPAEEALAWVEERVEDCLAIGEIGLDGYWVPEELWARQEEVFRRFVALAMRADKPIIIHSRKRERRALEILSELGAPRVNWHCYSSKVKRGLRIASEHGHYLSIPANARKMQNFTKLLAELPRDRILLETDCPYLSPVRGELNEPANVRSTVELAAELWDCSERAVQEQLEENFTRLFGVEP